jgi:serine/threonine-protein kinase
MQLALAEGALFAGRYQVVRCIAHGGMGAVYEVVHIETGRPRALKVILPNMVEQQDIRDRFRQEARVTARVESEFIADVSDAGVDAATGMPFLVMELLRGEELDKRLKRVGRFEAGEVVTYLHQVAMALEKTHRASIVHRDLKPGNLFLTERDDGSPRIKVLDFGIAKIVADAATKNPGTQSLGTPLYMATEQFQIGHQVSPATDIYSLGMLAFTFLVGVPYWHQEASLGANVFAFAAAAMHGPREPASVRALRYGVHLPPGFDAWFARAAAPSPQHRFGSALEAVSALADVLYIPLPAHRASFASLPAIMGMPNTVLMAPPDARGALAPAALPPYPNRASTPPPLAPRPPSGQPSPWRASGAEAAAFQGAASRLPSGGAPPPVQAPLLAANTRADMTRTTPGAAAGRRTGLLLGILSAGIAAAVVLVCALILLQPGEPSAHAAAPAGSSATPGQPTSGGAEPAAVAPVPTGAPSGSAAKGPSSEAPREPSESFPSGARTSSTAPDAGADSGASPQPKAPGAATSPKKTPRTSLPVLTMD